MGLAVFPHTKIFLPSHLFPHLGKNLKREVAPIPGLCLSGPVENTLPLAFLISLSEQPCLGRPFHPPERQIVFATHAQGITKINSQLVAKKRDVVIKNLLLECLGISRDDHLLIIFHSP